MDNYVGFFLRRKSAEITKLKNVADQLGSNVVRQKEEIDRLTKEVAELEKCCARKDERIGELEGTIDQLQGEIEGFRQ